MPVFINFITMQSVCTKSYEQLHIFKCQDPYLATEFYRIQCKNSSVGTEFVGTLFTSLTCTLSNVKLADQSATY